LTVIVNVFEEPEQLTVAFVNVGVTVMVATTGEVPVFIAVNAAMLPPVPLAARPMVGSEFVHE
jgi:hypothetical protein